MSYIYLASPYTHNESSVMDERYLQAAKFCAWCAREDIVIYSPIAHWHPIALRFNLPRHTAYWKAQDHVMLIGCREVWVLNIPGWETSAGVREEINFANSLNRPILYIEPDTYERHP